jgi:hypothetical protein
VVIEPFAASLSIKLNIPALQTASSRSRLKTKRKVEKGKCMLAIGSLLADGTRSPEFTIG